MRHLRLLIGTLVAVGLVAVLAVSPAFAPPPIDPPGLDRAIAVQEYHTDRLMAVPGVVGTAVGLGADGQPVVKIYTESVAVTGLPRSLDGVPVVIQVTGKIFALGHCADHTGGKPPPGCGGGGNNPPTADNKSVATPENTDVPITLSGSDEETCDLTFSIVSGPSNGTLSPITDQACTPGTPNTDTAVVTYSPATNFNGADSFTYTVSDGEATSNEATVSISVGDVTGDIDCFVTGDTTARCDRPVPSGVSTGHPIITAGTIGCRVTDGINVYALSNNHVYAAENDGFVPEGAIFGDNVLQPGPSDGGTDPADAIGTLYNWELINFNCACIVFCLCDPANDNVIDAAVALSSTADLDNATPSDGYGIPKSAIVSAAVNQNVQKYGRTTSLTKGTITAINATVLVGYNSGTARFVGQIIIESKKPFLKPGDSGSLTVIDGGLDDRKPVGLLFAGDRPGKMAIANPIDLVLNRLGVTVDGE